MAIQVRFSQRLEQLCPGLPSLLNEHAGEALVDYLEEAGGNVILNSTDLPEGKPDVDVVLGVYHVRQWVTNNAGGDIYVTY